MKRHRRNERREKTARNPAFRWSMRYGCIQTEESALGLAFEVHWPCRRFHAWRKPFSNWMICCSVSMK
ncbi:hypothetical protein M5689_019524 [Euphorbia peplus]|nr:hypothetical protein M5689_019524 [Euphorbia peplus]